MTNNEDNPFAFLKGQTITETSSAVARAVISSAVARARQGTGVVQAPRGAGAYRELTEEVREALREEGRQEVCRARHNATIAAAARVVKLTEKLQTTREKLGKVERRLHEARVAIERVTPPPGWELAHVAGDGVSEMLVFVDPQPDECVDWTVRGIETRTHGKRVHPDRLPHASADYAAASWVSEVRIARALHGSAE